MQWLNLGTDTAMFPDKRGWSMESYLDQNWRIIAVDVTWFCNWQNHQTTFCICSQDYRLGNRFFPGYTKNPFTRTILTPMSLFNKRYILWNIVLVIFLTEINIVWIKRIGFRFLVYFDQVWYLRFVHVYIFMMSHVKIFVFNHYCNIRINCNILIQKNHFN